MELKKDDIIPYLALGGGVALLLFTVFSTAIAPQQYVNQGYTFASNSETVPSECGNINDLSNIQHLSHHPDRYQACYKFIDPAKFKQATGQDISAYVK